MAQQLQTLRRASAKHLRESLTELNEHLAILEVDDLLCSVLNLSREQLLIDSSSALDDSQIARFDVMLQRRVKGEPLAYVLGEKEFFSLPFFVTPDTLIPRPETELLVERALLLLEAISDPVHVIDVGTGSGAIILAIAKELSRRSSRAAFAKIRFTAIDISEAALVVAEENARRLELTQNVNFVCSDMLEKLSHSDYSEECTLLVSNPPYIPDTEQLPSSVRDYEPASALFAGPEGLDCIRVLLESSKPWLEQDSRSALLFELGYGQQLLLGSLIRQLGFSEFNFYKDLQGITRVAEVACRKSFA